LPAKFAPLLQIGGALGADYDAHFEKLFTTSHSVAYGTGADIKTENEAVEEGVVYVSEPSRSHDALLISGIATTMAVYRHGLQTSSMTVCRFHGENSVLIS
jgi:hypothetical protein